MNDWMLFSFCGCCGRQMSGLDREADQFNDFWCSDCAKHVGESGPPWDRAYSAIHLGKECPYSVTLLGEER